MKNRLHMNKNDGFNRKMLKNRSLPLILMTVLGAPAYGLVDINGDGISDVWVQAYAAQGLDPAGDEDGDQNSNYAESVFGTDPFDKNSCLKVTNFQSVPNGLLLQWQGAAGVNYDLEHSDGLNESPWTEIASMAAGETGLRQMLIPKPSGTSAFFRLALKQRVLGSDFAFNDSPDTDFDGQSDAMELLAGTDPFDSGSTLGITTIQTGSSGASMAFQTVIGKSYRIQFLNTFTGNWEDTGDGMQGTGSPISASAVSPGSSSIFRVKVDDMDSDGDGVSDWEEWAMGLGLERTGSAAGDTSDMTRVATMLSTPVKYTLSARRPTVKVEGSRPGIFEIRRTEGFGPVHVPLVVAGDALVGRDYQPLPGRITIPFGESIELLPVETTPQAVSGKRVELSVAGQVAWPLSSASINVIRTSALDVKDFGAVGDGVTDDTDAIQAAINQLATSAAHNTLHFPPGTYALKKRVRDSNTGSGIWRQLILSSGNLAGRDLYFTGDPGSVILADQGSLRAHMMVFIATFRSLAFEGLTIRQGSVPKTAVAFGHSPNGSDGVSLVRSGTGFVEAITFDDCTFDNCHGSVFTYGSGYDTRGHLKQFGIYDCKALNPYGANTENSGIAYGGGIQFGLSPWVGTAVYNHSLFDGGGEDMTDASKSPGGRMKDGCHFGNPLHLEFTNNVVKRMGVEAVFQIGGSTYAGVTIDSFLMPPADGSSTATVQMDNLPSSFVAGDIINVRTTGGPTNGGTSRILTVVSFDPVTRTLVLKNLGNSISPATESSIPADAQVFMDRINEPSTADIRNNFLDGTIPPGAHSDTNPAGIVVNARGRISSNTVTNFEIGILLYPEVQTLLHPASRFSIVNRNSVHTRDPLAHSPFYTYGIQSWADDDVIIDNLVTTPNSFRFTGITARGKNTRIESNRVISLAPADNGYGNPNRSVGIGFGNQSLNTFIKNNTTYGFDVGVGPEDAHQDIPHRVLNHRSVRDVFGVDFRGLLPN